MPFLEAPGLFAVRFEAALFGTGFPALRFLTGVLFLTFLTGVPFLTEVRLAFAAWFLFFVVAIHAVYHRANVATLA